MPKLPGREPTFRTYELAELLVGYWLDPYGVSKAGGFRCVACGNLYHGEDLEGHRGWGARVVLATNPVEPVGEICPRCDTALTELYSEKRTLDAPATD